MFCDPDRCPNCVYIGEGDSLCEISNEIVLCDWEPTDEFMNSSCPYRKRPKRRRKRSSQKPAETGNKH